MDCFHSTGFESCFRFFEFSIFSLAVQTILRNFQSNENEKFKLLPETFVRMYPREIVFEIL